MHAVDHRYTVFGFLYDTQGHPIPHATSTNDCTKSTLASPHRPLSYSHCSPEPPFSLLRRSAT
jgi:hypothetical protein